MTLHKRIRRMVMANKARYLGAILLVALGSAAFLVLNTVCLNLSGSLDRLTIDGRLENAQAVLQRALGSVDAVQTRFDSVLEERRFADCRLSRDVTLRLFELTSKVNIPAIVSGRRLQTDDEVLLSPAFAEGHGYGIGDRIRIGRMTLKIVGYMTIPDYIYATRLESEMIADPQTFGIGVVTGRAMDGLPVAGSRWHIRYGSADPAVLKEYLSQKAGVALWQGIEDNTRYNMAKGEVAGLRDVAWPIPLAVFLLTCAMLAVIVWRIVKMEFAQIGTLCALGYSRAQIARHYLTLPFVIATLGAAAGVAVSLYLVGPVLGYYAYYYNLPLFDPQVNKWHIIFSVLLPVGMLLLTGMVVIGRALKQSPVQLMRGYGPRSGVGFLERRVKLGNLPFRTKFRIREMIRGASKLAVLILGVAGGSMLLLMGFVIQNSFASMISEGFIGTFRYQHNYVFKTLHMGAVSEGERYQIAACRLTNGSEDVIVYGLQRDSEMIRLVDRKGIPLPTTRNIVTRPLADQLSIRPGDEIGVENKITGRISRFRIDAVAETYTGSFLFVPIDDFNRAFGYPSGSYQGVFSRERLAIPPADLLKTEDVSETVRALESFLKPLRYALLGLGTLAFLIALIVVSVIISLLVEENRTSVSWLKVLGYSDHEVGDLVLNTGNIPVVMGYLLAIPVLLAYLGRVFQSSLQEVDMFVPVRLGLVDVAVGLAIIYGTYLLAKTLSRRKILSVPMAETLKAQRE